MEELINEEKIELAKHSLERGRLSVEEIAVEFDLPISVVQELAKQIKKD